jgi:hypothetical protein
VDTTGREDQIVEAKVTARDSLGRTGEGLALLWVPAGRVEIQLSPAGPAPGEVATASVRLLRGEMPEESSWVWRSEGGLSLVSENYKNSIQVKVDSPGKLAVFLHGLGPFGKQKTYAQGSLAVAPGAGKKTFQGCFNPPGVAEGILSCSEYAYTPERRTETGVAGCKVDGPVRLYQKDGPKFCDMQYRGGLLDGPYTLYMTDGRPSVKGSFKGGLRDGTWTWWYESGNRSHECQFREEKFNGAISSWHENGGKQYVGSCRDGLAAGTWQWWREDGSLQKDVTYSEDHYVVTRHDGKESRTETESGTDGCWRPEDGLEFMQRLMMVPEGCTPFRFNAQD